MHTPGASGIRRPTKYLNRGHKLRNRLANKQRQADENRAQSNSPTKNASYGGAVGPAGPHKPTY